MWVKKVFSSEQLELSVCLIHLECQVLDVFSLRATEGKKKMKRENSISSKPQYSVVCGFAETPHPFHGMVPGKFQTISSWPVWVCGHPKRSNEEMALFAMTAQPEVGTGKANCVSNRIPPPTSNMTLRLKPGRPKTKEKGAKSSRKPHQRLH